MDNITLTYLILAAIFGLYMAWGIGANDVANAMATSIGAKAISFRQAVFIAAIFEFLGAVLAGAETTGTIRKGIVDSDIIGVDHEAFMHGMLAALLGCAIWLNIASARGWPVSTTHSIVGGILGW
jgi:PiT family inorganic phosphate transporter